MSEPRRWMLYGMNAKGAAVVTGPVLDPDARVEVIEAAPAEAELERLRELTSHNLDRTDNHAYDLRQRLNRAVRWLREAEDIARIEMPAWPTADRIRDIYEQVNEDVQNGRTTVPPLRQRLAEAEAELERLQEVLSVLASWHIRDSDDGPAMREVARQALKR